MIPNTDAKEDIIEASASSYELFARDNYKEIQDITGPDLFNMYCQYVKINHFKECSSRTFVSNIKQFTGDSKIKRIDGKLYRVYNLKDEYIRKFKGYFEKLERNIVDEIY